MEDSPKPINLLVPVIIVVLLILGGVFFAVYLSTKDSTAPEDSSAAELPASTETGWTENASTTIDGGYTDVNTENEASTSNEDDGTITVTIRGKEYTFTLDQVYYFEERYNNDYNKDGFIGRPEVIAYDGGDTTTTNTVPASVTSLPKTAIVNQTIDKVVLGFGMIVAGFEVVKLGKKCSKRNINLIK